MANPEVSVLFLFSLHIFFQTVSFIFCSVHQRLNYSVQCPSKELNWNENRYIQNYRPSANPVCCPGSWNPNQMLQCHSEDGARALLHRNTNLSGQWILCLQGTPHSAEINTVSIAQSQKSNSTNSVLYTKHNVNNYSTCLVVLNNNNNGGAVHTTRHYHGLRYHSDWGPLLCAPLSCCLSALLWLRISLYGFGQGYHAQHWD